MKILFYMWALLALLFELQLMYNPGKWIEFKKRMKGVRYEDATDTQKTFLIMAILYVIWCFVGFFSSQWVLFILMFIIGIPLSIFKESKVAKSIDGFLSSCIILFILINAFHLHLDIPNYVMSLFGV